VLAEVIDLNLKLNNVSKNDSPNLFFVIKFNSSTSFESRYIFLFFKKYLCPELSKKSYNQIYLFLFKFNIENSLSLYISKILYIFKITNKYNSSSFDFPHSFLKVLFNLSLNSFPHQLIILSI